MVMDRAERDDLRATFLNPSAFPHTIAALDTCDALEDEIARLRALVVRLWTRGESMTDDEAKLCAEVVSEAGANVTVDALCFECGGRGIITDAGPPATCHVCGGSGSTSEAG